VVATFRQPFDLLAETTAIAARHAAGNTAKRAKSDMIVPTHGCFHSTQNQSGALLQSRALQKVRP
jgi:hypothetical protein